MWIGKGGQPFCRCVACWLGAPGRAEVPHIQQCRGRAAGLMPGRAGSREPDPSGQQAGPCLQKTGNMRGTCGCRPAWKQAHQLTTSGRILQQEKTSSERMMSSVDLACG